MGVPQELSGRRGAALPSAIFGLVAVSVLATAIFASSRTQSQATRNRESTTRAIQLAENGLTHALVLVGDSLKGYTFDRLLKGPDNDGTAVADNGRLTGYILSSAADIPTAGRAATGGTYTAQVIDDADNGNTDPTNDINLKVIIRCTATTNDGGSATVDAMVSQVVLPALAVDGNLSFAASTSKILGECGSVHANGNVTIATGTAKPIIAGTITATGTTSGTALDTLSATKTPQPGKPSVEVPDMNPADYCGATATGVRWRLRADGKMIDNNTGVAHTPPWKGWSYVNTTSTPRSWQFTTAGTGGYEEGRVCVDGNATVSGNMGSFASPYKLSVIATGSIFVNGAPYLAPANGDSVLFVAGGDMKLEGNASGSQNSYEGLIYAENQCIIAGTPIISAQILCKNKTATTVTTTMTAISGYSLTPFLVHEYGIASSVAGTPTLKYQCGGIFAKRRVFSWLQRAS